MPNLYRCVVPAACLAVALFASACGREAATGGNTSPDCIDPAKIRPDGICTMQYDPVCGCDGKTYSNACVAGNAGVTSYTKGECPGN